MNPPDKILYKKASINTQNDENMCFKWAVLSALHPGRNAYHISEYRRYEGELNSAGIEFPVTPNRISKCVGDRVHSEEKKKRI